MSSMSFIFLFSLREIEEPISDLNYSAANDLTKSPPRGEGQYTKAISGRTQPLSAVGIGIAEASEAA